MSKKKIDVEGILKTLASIREQVPHLPKTPAKPVAGDTAGEPAFTADDESMELFELETLADALESFAGELSESIETAEAKAMVHAMEIYYAAEKLSKDPEHAHLIPYVEQMRAIYRRDFGKDIPERKE